MNVSNQYSISWEAIIIYIIYYRYIISWWWVIAIVTFDVPWELYAHNLPPDREISSTYNMDSVILRRDLWLLVVACGSTVSIAQSAVSSTAQGVALNDSLV